MDFMFPHAKEKRCRVCRDVLPIGKFYPDASKRDGHRGECKECVKRFRKSYYANNLAEVRAKQKIYYEAHRAEWRAAARKLRTDALEHYGGKCTCCGETTPEFLAIDHVNDDGEAHRSEISGCGRAIYQWLKKHGYPDDGRFQVLCHNCNMAKGLYGLCPHQGTPPYERRKRLRAMAATD